MAAPALPLRLRQNIRDQITSKETPLTEATSKVSSAVGLPVVLGPDWVMLWSALQSYFPDQATFIPTIVSVITTWCHAFVPWLEDVSNEAVTERILSGLKSAGDLKLVLEISPTSSRPTTAWHSESRFFAIALPKARSTNLQTVLAGFNSDFRQLSALSSSLVSDSGTSSDSTAVVSPIPVGKLDDPVAGRRFPGQASMRPDVTLSPAGVLRAVSSTRGTESSTATQVLGDDYMPDINTLERPEELTQRAPYWLVVRQEGWSRVYVESTHMESLKFIEAYLTRWVRNDMKSASRPPLATIKLRESAFGLGLLYDTLLMEAGKNGDINALMVLMLVESVLGYELIPGSGGGNGNVWEFKRMRGFK